MTIDPTALGELTVGEPANALFLGLFGLLAFAILALHADHTLRTFGGGGSSEPKTGCPGCGDRTAAAADRCGHCGRSLHESEEPPDRGWSER